MRPDTGPVGAYQLFPAGGQTIGGMFTPSSPQSPQKTLPPQAQELLTKMTSAVVSQLDPKAADVPATAHATGNGAPATIDGTRVS